MVLISHQNRVLQVLYVFMCIKLEKSNVVVVISHQNWVLQCVYVYLVSIYNL